jgi:hypothetical protein
VKNSKVWEISKLSTKKIIIKKKLTRYSRQHKKAQSHYPREILAEALTLSATIRPWLKMEASLLYRHSCQRIYLKRLRYAGELGGRVHQGHTLCSWTCQICQGSILISKTFKNLNKNIRLFVSSEILEIRKISKWQLIIEMSSRKFIKTLSKLWELSKKLLPKNLNSTIIKLRISKTTSLNLTKEPLLNLNSTLWKSLSS